MRPKERREHAELHAEILQVRPGSKLVKTVEQARAVAFQVNRPRAKRPPSQAVAERRIVQDAAHRGRHVGYVGRVEVKPGVIDHFGKRTRSAVQRQACHTPSPRPGADQTPPAATAAPGHGPVVEMHQVVVGTNPVNWTPLAQPSSVYGRSKLGDVRMEDVAEVADEDEPGGRFAGLPRSGQRPRSIGAGSCAGSGRRHRGHSVFRERSRSVPVRHPTRGRAAGAGRSDRGPRSGPRTFSSGSRNQASKSRRAAWETVRIRSAQRTAACSLRPREPPLPGGKDKLGMGQGSVSCIVTTTCLTFQTGKKL